MLALTSLVPQAPQRAVWPGELDSTTCHSWYRGYQDDNIYGLIAENAILATYIIINL